MKPSLETLEPRDNPSVAIVGSDVVVTGTAGNDVLRVQALVSPNVRVTDNGVVTVLALPPGGHVVVDALGGHDNVTLLGAVPGELLGGDGNDTITGGSIGDVIRGGSGSDLLAGGAGHDAIEGGAGMDRLSGDSGNDTLIGGAVVGYDYAMLSSAATAWGTGGVTDPALVAATADTEVDRLTGGSTADWFVANAYDTLTDYVSPPDALDVV